MALFFLRGTLIPVESKLFVENKLNNKFCIAFFFSVCYNINWYIVPKLRQLEVILWKEPKTK